jgi:hypothetical protein
MGKSSGREGLGVSRPMGQAAIGPHTRRDSPGRALIALISEPQPSPRHIAALLDGLSHEERVAATRALGRDAQRRLWKAVDGFGELTLDDFVPRETPPLTPVRHYGRNTLLAFTLFEKRFYRMGDGTRAAGANFQTHSWFTGPGYFVATLDEKRREVLVDYRRLPTEKPSGWPKIRANERGISRFIYGFMVDTMRRVSTHVSIGSAARNGKDIHSWFVLCREELP